MAVLTAGERAAVLASLEALWSKARRAWPSSIDQGDVAALIAAVDDHFESIEAGCYAAIPEPWATEMTQAEKVEAMAAVISLRLAKLG